MNEECIKCSNYLQCHADDDVIQFGCRPGTYFTQATEEQLAKNIASTKEVNDQPFPDPVYECGVNYAAGIFN